MSKFELEPVRVLLVGQDEQARLGVSGLLERHDRTRFILDWSRGFEQALIEIGERRHDLYLIEARLGERSALELVREGFATCPHAPVLILTDEETQELDLEASALGVSDYLPKRELTPTALARAIRYAIDTCNALREKAHSEERYALAVRATNDGIWDWDLAADRMYFSPRWNEILGRDEDAEHGSPEVWFGLVHDEDLPALKAAIGAHLAGRSPHLKSEHRVRHADGSWRWVLARGLAIRDPGGAPTRLGGSLSDVTDRHNAERQLAHDALHDGLTSLPNRALFMNRLDQAIQRSRRSRERACALLFIDLDHFKLVNEGLSHAVGDRLLVAFARRVAGALRPGDTVARIGGDEFAVLLDGIAGAEEALAVADRVQDLLADAFLVEGRELCLTASIGVAIGGSSIDAGELMRNADIAMYDAKRHGRARNALFDQSMHRRVVERLTRETELRQAIDDGLLRIHYQPIVELETGRLHGLEALVRWPEGWEELGPLEFIPLAEELGVIGALGEYVMRNAVRTMARWQRAGVIPDGVHVSVNVSGRQLEDLTLPAQVGAAITAAGLPARALRLEITESTLMHDPERMRSILAEVCASGVGLYLDDFGTGYSSLAALHRFPVDALKIDRSFVSSLEHEESGGTAIIRSTVALARSLGLEVIAEGIETPGQLRRLHQLGCAYGQGFIFSEAQSAEQIEEQQARYESPFDASGKASAIT